eukprot:gene10323-3656_t
MPEGGDYDRGYQAGWLAAFNSCVETFLRQGWVGERPDPCPDCVLCDRCRARREAEDAARAREDEEAPGRAAGGGPPHDGGAAAGFSAKRLSARGAALVAALAVAGQGAGLLADGAIKLRDSILIFGDRGQYLEHAAPRPIAQPTYSAEGGRKKWAPGQQFLHPFSPQPPSLYSQKAADCPLPSTAASDGATLPRLSTQAAHLSATPLLGGDGARGQGFGTRRTLNPGAGPRAGGDARPLGAGVRRRGQRRDVVQRRRRAAVRAVRRPAAALPAAARKRLHWSRGGGALAARFQYLHLQNDALCDAALHEPSIPEVLAHAGGLLDEVYAHGHRARGVGFGMQLGAPFGGAHHTERTIANRA